jgi:hypothetical protein
MINVYSDVSEEHAASIFRVTYSGSGGHVGIRIYQTAQNPQKTPSSNYERGPSPMVLTKKF